MIEIINQTNFGINHQLLKKTSRQLFDYFQIPKNHILEILFLDENDIKSLNWSYRSHASPTDVLSFPSPAIPNLKKTQVFGSIVICPAYIQQTKQNYDNYLPFLVHGFLHLAGYNHETVPERQDFQKINHLLSQKMRINEYSL
jgi:probable rRNA maturation factor